MIRPGWGPYNSHPVTLLPFCQWLADTRGSIALPRISLYMYPLVESTHVLTLCLFLGMAVMLDLRLLGLALQRVPMTEITRRLGPWMAAGFVVMVITGGLLFYAIPVRSYQNIFFRIKIITLALAGLNALIFHTTVHRRMSQDRDLVTPKGAHGAPAWPRWCFLGGHRGRRTHDCLQLVRLR